MAQETISFILCFILFIYQNSNIGAATYRAKESKHPTDCPNCKEPDKKIKMEELLAREAKFVKDLSDNFNKYKYGKNIKGVNYLWVKGWGARGMPFNVLYTPNVHQRKMMKSIPKKPEKLLKKQPKPMPEFNDFVLEEEKPSRKTFQNSFKKPRKYYSLIPQLFVSYGW